MQKLVIEIRAAEGGADARLLVTTQAGIYLNYARRQGLAVHESAAGPG